MRYAFSLPTKSDKVPAGSDWIHEIKHDGYRMLVIRERDRVRLISRGGHDWAKRFPLVVTAALKLPQESFVLDGEVVALDKEGKSDFDALASRKHDKRAQFYAFDLLTGDGEDLRPWPLALRKGALAGLLSDPVDGIFIAEYEQGGPKIAGRDFGSDIGDVLFRVACNMGLEGIVSKRLDHGYCAGGANIGLRSRTQRTRHTAGSGTTISHSDRADPRSTKGNTPRPAHGELGPVEFGISKCGRQLIYLGTT
jgi:bifunctional non-homologous end joining protein LigD